MPHVLYSAVADGQPLRHVLQAYSAIGRDGFTADSRAKCLSGVSLEMYTVK